MLRNPIPDVVVYSAADGALIGFEPITHNGVAWIEENTSHERWQWQNETLWCEARYAELIASAMVLDGLLIKAEL